jgi:hypothetical protein
MKLLFCLIPFLFLAGCGDESTSNTTQEPGSNPVSFLCSHEGDLWLCPDGGGSSCVRDESTSEVAAEEVPAEEEGATARTRYVAKLNSGAITIIAECGSNVTFSNNEETSSDYDANVTTTTANFGYNTEAAQ